MAEGLNKVYLMGNLGADAELKQYASGSKLSFRIATTERYKDKNGDKQERTEWHRCSLWGHRAEKLAPHLTKGLTLFVEGRIEHSSYEKNGQTHYATDVRVRDIRFVGSGARAVGGHQDHAAGNPRMNDILEGRPSKLFPDSATA